MALVTLLNYVVIVIESDTVLEIAKDFIAMVVISNFDDFFYIQHRASSEISKDVIDKSNSVYAELFTIKASSSPNSASSPDDPNLNKMARPAATTWLHNLYASFKNDNEEHRETTVPEHIRIPERSET